MSYKIGTGRKGVSTLIATLLIIAVSVAASVLTYTWVISMVNSQSMQSQTQIRVEQVIWLDPRHFIVEVRNIGSVAVTIDEISIIRNEGGVTLESDKDSTSIPINSVSNISVTLTNATLQSYTNYVVKVVTTTGFYYPYTAMTGTIS